jgi:hypothetical protein
VARRFANHVTNRGASLIGDENPPDAGFDQEPYAAALQPVADIRSAEPSLPGVVAWPRDAWVISCQALAAADPMGPAPLFQPPRLFATCADVMRLDTTDPWTWKG